MAHESRCGSTELVKKPRGRAPSRTAIAKPVGRNAAPGVGSKDKALNPYPAYSKCGKFGPAGWGDPAGLARGRRRPRRYRLRRPARSGASGAKVYGGQGMRDSPAKVWSHSPARCGAKETRTCYEKARTRAGTVFTACWAGYRVWSRFRYARGAPTLRRVRRDR